jgi:hypothetical protein
MKTLRSSIVPFLCMLMPIVIALQGCGDAHPTSVPDGSTITVSPSGLTSTITANISQDFSVTVKDESGSPINKAQVRITGAFAEPRNSTNTNPRYQFYSFLGGENTVGNGNIPVDSGFTGETDRYGVYNFSITIYGTVGGLPNTFTDIINIHSGTAFGSVSLSIS